MTRDFKNFENISIYDAYYGLTEGAFESDTYKGVIAKWIDTSKTENNTIEMFSDGKLYVYGELISNSMQKLINFFNDESKRMGDFQLTFIHLEFK